MPLYYIETDRGCTIHEAPNENRAYENAAKEVGDYNVERIRLATDQDIQWVGAMGGRLPGAARKIYEGINKNGK